MKEEKKIFEHEMEVATVTSKQTKENGKQKEEEEIMLRGTNCLLALRQFEAELPQLSDGEIVKVVITRG